MYLEKETYAIIGAAMEVHKRLGYGFTEYVYQDALEIEFLERNIIYEREKKIDIDYKGHILHHYYIADFLCYDNVIVECKALSALDESHHAQILNYMNATDISVGLLLNFGEASLNYKRFII